MLYNCAFSLNNSIFCYNIIFLHLLSHGHVSRNVVSEVEQVIIFWWKILFFNTACTDESCTVRPGTCLEGKRVTWLNPAAAGLQVQGWQFVRSDPSCVIPWICGIPDISTFLLCSGRFCRTRAVCVCEWDIRGRRDVISDGKHHHNRPPATSDLLLLFALPQEQIYVRRVAAQGSVFSEHMEV